jgi:hypothetical protein
MSSQRQNCGCRVSRSDDRHDFVSSTGNHLRGISFHACQHSSLKQSIVFDNACEHARRIPEHAEVHNRLFVGGVMIVWKRISRK